MPAIADAGAWSARISGKTLWTFVRVRDDDGRSGWGEATLQHQAVAIHGHVDRWAPALAGRPVLPGSPADDLIADRHASAAHAAAWSAIDQARWDLAGQAEGKTVAGMLGAPVRSAIALYANINRGTADRSADGFAARARDVAASGFDAIKIAPFDDVDPAAIDTAAGRRLVARGVERVHAVRSAIGPARRLLVDCHWRLTEAAASDVIRRLAPAALHWLECPLPEDASTLAALRRLRSQANERGMRLAGCESMTGLGAFRAFLDAGAYDVIMPDVKYAGGLAEMLRIGEAAERQHVECSPHNPTGPIAHLHSLHVASLLRSFPFLEFQHGESPRFFDLVDGDLPDPMRGTSALPRGAGLGAGVDLAKLAPISLDVRAEAHGAAVR